MRKDGFLGWIQKVFATIMKTVFPTLTVKYFTIRSSQLHDNQYSIRGKLYCPGMKKELKAMERLNLSELEIQQREWSRETRLELLRRGNYVLLERSHTPEEFDIVCENGDANTVALLFLRCTPTREYLQGFLQNHFELAQAVILQSPAIFNDLRFEDLLALPDEMALKYLSLLINYHKDLAPKAKKVALRWAETIATVWLNTPVGMEAAKQELYEKAIDVLIAEDYDMTSMLDGLEGYHNVCYCRVRDCAHESAHCASYAAAMFPSKWYRAGSAEELPVYYYGEKLVSEQDALVWVSLAYEKMFDVAVCEAVLRSCKNLKYPDLRGYLAKLREQVIEKVHGYDTVKLALETIPVGKVTLQNKLVVSIATVDQAHEALQILPESYHDSLRKIMVSETNGKNGEVLLQCFPFTDWALNTAESAIRVLARLKLFPESRVAELRPELQIALRDELEKQSELDIIRDVDSFSGNERLDRLVSRQENLHTEAENALFNLSFGFNKYKKKYILLHQMSDSAFTGLVNLQYDSKFRCMVVELKDWIEYFVDLHARTWGLTQNNYNALMRSNEYSHLAPLLKEYLKKAVSDPATEANLAV